MAIVSTTKAIERPPLRQRILKWLWQGLFFLVLLVLFQGFAGWLQAPRLPNEAPAFALADLSGQTVSLEDFAGQTVVLNFWATWCPPCRMEIPSFSRFAEGNPEVPVLGIAVDGGPEELARARDEMGITYPILLADESTLAAYGVRSLPTTVIIRPDGTVKTSYAGMLFRPQLWFLTR